MLRLNFWLHMNDEYMWRWFCTDDQGSLVAISAQSFFDLSNAERAMHVARECMGNAAIAA
jgi:hypothetical protein